MNIFPRQCPLCNKSFLILYEKEFTFITCDNTLYCPGYSFTFYNSPRDINSFKQIFCETYCVNYRNNMYYLLNRISNTGEVICDIYNLKEVSPILSLPKRIDIENISRILDTYLILT